MRRWSSVTLIPLCFELWLWLLVELVRYVLQCGVLWRFGGFNRST